MCPRQAQSQPATQDSSEGVILTNPHTIITNPPHTAPAFRGRTSPLVAAPLQQQAEQSTPADDAGRATAPEFPVLPALPPRATPLFEGGSGEEEELGLSHVLFSVDEEPKMAEPPKCSDCLEFYASDGSRCSMCARIARGGAVAADPEEKLEDAGYDDKMVLVGAAVVGAGIGALAGGLAAVVGAGAGAYAATRPQGDKVGDTARLAGRGVVQGGEKISVTAEKIATRAREARLSERAAGAREQLEGAAHSLDRRAREIDAEYNVTGTVQRASVRVQESAQSAAVKASSLVRWASDQAAALHRQRQDGRSQDRETGSLEDEEHC